MTRNKKELLNFIGQTSKNLAKVTFWLIVICIVDSVGWLKLKIKL